MTKKNKSKLYSYKDFCGMDDAEKFGFFCLLKLDNIVAPDPEDYADVYREWKTKGDVEIAQELADAGFNK